MTKRVVLVLLALLLMGIAACSKQKPTEDGTDAAKPVEGGRLHLSLYSAPKGIFQPIFSEDRSDAQINSLIYSGLLQVDEELAYVCDLCESYEVSENQKRITFHLREDVKWHDGRPFTAADVAFTFRTLLHPDYPGLRTGSYAALAGVQPMLDERDRLARQVGEEKLSSQEAAKRREKAWAVWLQEDGARAIQLIDDHTIAFNSDQPYAPLMAHLSFPIVAEHLFGDLSMAAMAEHEAVRRPVGTGPYRFADHQVDESVQVERYLEYHLGRPYIEAVLFHVLTRADAINGLQAGEVDQAPVTATEARTLKDAAQVQVVGWPSRGYQYMGVKHDHAVLSDQRVRQALMYGIDRQGIVDELLDGYGTVMRTHMLPGHWAYDADSLNHYPHDPQKARELLAEAGWTESTAKGYLKREGKVLGFTLKYPEGNRLREASAERIKQDLKTLGFKVDLVKMAFGELAKEVFTDRTADAWLMAWDLGLDPDPGPVFLSNNKWGRATGWVNEENERLIRQAARQLGREERKPLYSQWAHLLNDELPYIFLYAPYEMEAIRTDRLRGVKPDARGLLGNVRELWIPKEMQTEVGRSG